MSYYVGIDLSTHAVDLVKLDEDSDRAEWVRVPLVGEIAIDRARSYREHHREYLKTRRPGWVEKDGEQIDATWVYPFWDDVILCALEDPAGRGDTRKIARVQGVVIATIPSRVQVWTLQPAEWRRHCGLKGSASKDDVFAWAMRHWPYKTGDLLCTPQDAADAYCIAYAARAINASAASVAEGNQTQED